jgi:DNA-binding transcriptional LysR family regulator
VLAISVELHERLSFCEFWLKMVEFFEMRTIVLVAESESISATARSLKMSPAAISKQLTRVEAELGLHLFVRTTRKVELTDVGRSYYEQCKRVLEEVQLADDLVSHIQAAPQGVLKVVSGRHFAQMFIVPYLKEFLELYPQVSLNLELAERVPDLVNEGIDLSIGMSISAEGDVIQRRIASTRYVLCASPKYLKKYGTPRVPSDLVHHRYLAHSMRRPADILNFSGCDPIQVKPYVSVNDTEALLSLATQGLGIAMLHHYVVDEALRERALKEVLASYLDVDMPIYVAFPQRKYVPNKVRSFIQFVERRLKTHIPVAPRLHRVV